MSGAAEAAAFTALVPPSERDVEHVAHRVLMALLPALADGDLDTFGASLSEVWGEIKQADPQLCGWIGGVQLPSRREWRGWPDV